MASPPNTMASPPGGSAGSSMPPVPPGAAMRMSLESVASDARHTVHAGQAVSEADDPARNMEVRGNGRHGRQDADSLRDSNNAGDGHEAPATEADLQAQRALDKINRKNYQDGDDAKVVAKGCVQKMIAAAILTEQSLDRLPFPQIRPMSLLRKPGCLHKTFEANRCCYFCARRGPFLCGLLRKLLLLCCFLMTFISFMLRIFPPLALNNTLDKEALYEFPWAVGIYTCIKPETCLSIESRVYIGLSSFLVDSISPEVRMSNIIPFEETPKCPDTMKQLGPENYCELCKTAATHSAVVSLMSIPFAMFSFCVDIQRMTTKNDHNCVKNFALIIHFCSLLLLCLAVTVFFFQCVHIFPKYDASSTFTMELEIAKGGLLVVFALLSNVCMVIIHVLIPVPEARWRYVPEEQDPADGMWPRIAPKKSHVVDAGLGGRASDRLSLNTTASMEERQEARSNFLRVFTRRLHSMVRRESSQQLQVDDFDGVDPVAGSAKPSTYGNTSAASKNSEVAPQ